MKNFFSLLILATFLISLAGCNLNFNIKQPLSKTNFSPADQALPLAPKELFNMVTDTRRFTGQKFRFQGCLEPHTSDYMGPETCIINKAGIKFGCIDRKCSLEKPENCGDCLRMDGECPIVDVQQVPKEKLVEIRKTMESKYYVEVVGTYIGPAVSMMRPIEIIATDLKILGECPTQK